MYGARAAGNFLFCGDVMMLGPLTKVHDLHETYDFPLCNKYIEAAKKGTKVENHADHADHASLGRSKLGPILALASWAVGWPCCANAAAESAAANDTPIISPRIICLLRVVVSGAAG